MTLQQGLAFGLVIATVAAFAWGRFRYDLIALGALLTGLLLGVIHPKAAFDGFKNDVVIIIGMALVVSAAIARSGRLRYLWVTALPLAWLTIVTTTAAWQKLLSPNAKISFIAAANDMAAKLAAGTLPPDKAAVAPQLIFNQRLDAALTAFLVLVLWVVLIDMTRTILAARGGRVQASTESPYVASRFAEASGG